MDEFNFLHAFFYLIRIESKSEREQIFQILEEERQKIAQKMEQDSIAADPNLWYQLSKNSTLFSEEQPENLTSKSKGTSTPIYTILDSKNKHIAWLYDDCAVLIFCTKDSQKHNFPIEEKNGKEEIRFIGDCTLSINDEKIQPTESLGGYFPVLITKRFYLNRAGFDWQIYFERSKNFSIQEKKDQDKGESHIILNDLMFLFVATMKIKWYAENLKYDISAMEKWEANNRRLEKNDKEEIENIFNQVENNIQKAKEVKKQILRVLTIDLEKGEEKFSYVHPEQLESRINRIRNWLKMKGT